jgi:site-specific DNA recombinase
MKHCFGYVRVSTVKQGDGVSLEAQRDAIVSFASRNQIAIVQWFEEKETAAKRGRPIFNKMVGELRRGKAQGLVVHKIDRSARNFTDWAKIGDLQDAGIDIHFATETLDFASRGGRLTADIQAVIAADYVRNLREETIKGITGRLKQGLYPFKAPIGYVDNGGGKVKTLDPVRAPFIKTAFELYASGQHSQRSLQAELDRLGLRTPEGRPLSKTGLESVLRNPFYCGIIRIQCSGAVYQGIHEPLISASLFERVQNAKAGRTVQKITRHAFLYRRLFRCGECAGAMIPERQKGHVYYRCQTKGCITKTVREERLEEAIIDCLAGVKLSPEDIATVAEQLPAWLETHKEPSKNDALPLQLAAVKERLCRLTDALIDRLIDNATFNERKAALLLEEALIKEKAVEASKVWENANHLPAFLELTNNLARTYQSVEPAEKQQLVELVTSNRTVSGKNICLEPANWLAGVGQTVSALCGALDPATARRGNPIDLADEKHTIMQTFGKLMHEAPPFLQATLSESPLTSPPPNTNEHYYARLCKSLK